jgi:hypothetical protein
VSRHNSTLIFFFEYGKAGACLIDIARSILRSQRARRRADTLVGIRHGAQTQFYRLWSPRHRSLDPYNQLNSISNEAVRRRRFDIDAQCDGEFRIQRFGNSKELWTCHREEVFVAAERDSFKSGNDNGLLQIAILVLQCDGP